MGIYDQFLQLTQHGLDQGTQMAQQRAAMPSMADVFMDRFRQGGQDRMAQQKMASDLALNQAYKTAQMQQMENNALNQSRQRDIELQKYVSENLVGDNRPEILATVLAHGGSEAMVPKRKYEDYQYETPTEAALSGDSLAGGIPDTKMETGQAPIAYSDWGTQAMFKDKALSLKEKLASMSEETKRYLGSVKANDAKSAVGKIMQDLASGRISQPLAHDAILKATIFFDPARAALIGQGLNPAGSGLPIQTFGQTPGATQLPQQAQPSPQPMQQPDNGIVWHDIPGQAQTPIQRPQVASRIVVSKPAAKPSGQPKEVPGPVPFGGGNAATAVAEEEDKYGNSKILVDQLISTAEKALNNKALARGIYMPVIGQVRSPADPDTRNLEADLKALGTQEALSQIAALKARSGTGIRLTQAEWTALTNAIASLDTKLEPKALAENLNLVKTYSEKIKKQLEEGHAAKMKAKNAQTAGPDDLDAFLASKGY